VRRLCFILLCLLAQWPAAEQAAVGGDAGFSDLLGEAELLFNRPDGFIDLAPGRTPILDYERALRSADGQLELRIAIRPLKRLQIDYDDPHGAVPNPEHIFPLVFESLATRLSGGGHAPSNPYPPDQARAKFNADWAAAAVFDTIEDFATHYTQGLLVAIHRNKVSDAYLVFLFNDYAAVKGELQAAMDTLVFLPTPQGGEKPVLPGAN